MEKQFEKLAPKNRRKQVSSEIFRKKAIYSKQPDALMTGGQAMDWETQHLILLFYIQHKKNQL